MLTSNNNKSNALNQYTAVGSFNPTYDADGNQINAQALPLGSSSLASCVYSWDGENRLISTTVGTNTTTYKYDSQSRRIAKTSGETTTIYVYDGWNLIAQYVAGSLTKSYTWGMDLSGSMQGAGGVGGLLAVTEGSVTHYPTYDGNGNISEYLDGTGAVQAHYEYDAFGKQTVSIGSLAATFEYRFSTKPLDPETGMYYYGYRYYDANTGRWVSRDPIEERGGVNLYAFVGNDGINYTDYLGESTAEQFSEEINHTLNTIDGFTPLDLTYSIMDSRLVEMIKDEKVANPSAIITDDMSTLKSDIERRMNALKNDGKCPCVEKLVIWTHGGEGAFALSHKYSYVERNKERLVDLARQAFRMRVRNKTDLQIKHGKMKYHRELKKLSEDFESLVGYMCKYRKLEIVSCRSGEGYKGEALKKDLDDIFGGGVVAPLYKTDVWPFLSIPFTLPFD